MEAAAAASGTPIPRAAVLAEHQHRPIRHRQQNPGLGKYMARAVCTESGEMQAVWANRVLSKINSDASIFK